MASKLSPFSLSPQFHLFFWHIWVFFIWLCVEVPPAFPCSYAHLHGCNISYNLNKCHSLRETIPDHQTAFPFILIMDLVVCGVIMPIIDRETEAQRYFPQCNRRPKNEVTETKTQRNICFLKNKRLALFVFVQRFLV